MELHERLNTSKAPMGPNDPFAEVKSRVHFTVIGDLGPQLYNVSMDPEDLRERVLADVRDQLAQEGTPNTVAGAQTFWLARILNFKFAGFQIITVSQSWASLHCQPESE